jgi:hypothetical protein
MKTFRKIFGVLSIVCAIVNLLRGDWLGCALFSVWAVLFSLDPKRPEHSRLRSRLTLIALVLVILRVLFR